MADPSWRGEALPEATRSPRSAERLKVLMLINKLHPGGGAERVTAALATHLPRDRFDVFRASAVRLAGFARTHPVRALLGAHIIKIKLSTDHLENKDARKVYQEQGIDISTQAARVRHCMDAAFGRRRIVGPRQLGGHDVSGDGLGVGLRSSGE